MKNWKKNLIDFSIVTWYNASEIALKAHERRFLH